MVDILTAVLSGVGGATTGLPRVVSISAVENQVRAGASAILEGLDAGTGEYLGKMVSTVTEKDLDIPTAVQVTDLDGDLELKLENSEE